MGLHIGRHWSSTYQHRASNAMDQRPTIEDGCPCEQEPCGMIDSDKVNPDCPQHGMGMTKTIRSSHSAEDCPARRKT